MSDSASRCSICRGGPLKPGTTRLHLWRDDQLIVIQDIPADVCEQCKEGYISAEVSKKLDLFIGKPIKCQPDRYLTVPVFSAMQFMDAN